MGWKLTKNEEILIGYALDFLGDNLPIGSIALETKIQNLSKESIRELAKRFEYAAARRAAHAKKNRKEPEVN